MGTAPVKTQDAALDWDALAKDLNLPDGTAAAKRAFEIAKYVARVENNDDEKLILKKGSKLFELNLKQ